MQWFHISRYNMLSTEDLLKIPIAQLLNPGALVAVWCTNSEKHISDLQNRLMPAWGIKPVASWCWLKVNFLLFRKVSTTRKLRKFLFKMLNYKLVHMIKLLLHEDFLIYTVNHTTLPFFTR